MKLLVTSDLHGEFNQLDQFITDDIEAICFAGDIAPLNGRGKWHIYDQVKWMRTKFSEFAEKHSDKQIILTPGNHDFFMIAKSRFNNPFSKENWNVEVPENVHILVDQEFQFKDKRFYGSPWVPIISYSWAYEAESPQLKEHFSKIPSGLDVLLTHCPPHISSDVLIDRSTQFGLSQAFGSSELTEVIIDKQPKYAFCGHIHTGTHEKVFIDNTMCQNVSRLDENYEIAYNPLILEI